MNGIVWSPISGGKGDPLIVLDAERRLYAGLSHEGDYWHVVAPLLVEIVNTEGEILRPVGALACRCKGATFRNGTCYRVAQAEQFEGSLALEQTGIAWFDAPAGAGDSVEAYRG